MQKRFKNIFGLSRKAPACLAEGNGIGLVASDVETSDSGIYLDEMDNLNLNILDASDDCGIGSIWDLMNKARANALKELETSLLAGLASVTKQNRTPFAGFIGQPNHRGLNLVEEGSRQSLSLQTQYLESVSMKVKRIGLLINANAVVGVTVGGGLGTFEVVATANTPSFYTFTDDAGKPNPLSIPFDGRQIDFSYLAEGFKPFNNETGCGCGIKDQNLAAFFGKANPVLSRPAAGIILDVEISCNPLNMIFVNNDQTLAIANVLAYAARYKAAELLVERILNSDAINRYTMLEPEYLFGKRNHFRKEYQDRVNWLISVDGFDLSKDACYICKTTTGFRKVGILS